MMQSEEGVLLRPIPSVIVYPEMLPVAERRAEIAAAIAANQVVVIAGETGSGKTTQIPKICLELGRGRQARIGHTQPRRLAARTVAQRIAEELNSPLGGLVGYQIRFNDSVSDATAIKLMTDGILLSELQRDRELLQYDTLIIDEAHERSLNIDFILGYLKQLLPRRPDLKVIITSATIDVERFSAHFDKAPIIEVSGRTYPVDVHYLGDVEDRDEGVQQQIVGLIDDIEAGQFGPRGDVLVFLPGEREIRELVKNLKGRDRVQLLPLYARLSKAEQDKVFNPSGRGMRVIIATNVAETSLTVPGIRYVIDPGEARISRYSHRTRLQRLPIEGIAQASANQRMGRCGRIAAGVCFRLYSEQDFLARPEFTDPEILRTNLAAVILKMLELGLGKVTDFPFVDRPEPKMVRDGYRLLEELGAVSARGKLTTLGRKMAHLPIDPKLARMLLSAAERQCLAEVLVIVSAMSIQDPRERPSDKQAQADQAHAVFKHTQSDFLVWVNLWRYYEAQRQSQTQSQLRKLCKKDFLSFIRMREWRDIHGQLTIACRQLGLKPAVDLPEEERYESVHKALLAGLLGNVAQQDEGRVFNATRQRKIQVFPGSGQYRKPPKWLVAADIVETTQVFARQCAAIEPEWLLRINPQLLKRQHYEPAWQLRTGRVMAIERVTLYGLVISDGKRVHFGEIDPKTSRQLMIRNGLVPGHYKSPPAFLKANLALIRSVQELESRARRRDLLVDEDQLFQFYDQRLPSEVVSGGALDQYLRKNPDSDARLRLARDQILTKDPGDEMAAQFPATLTCVGTEYRLSYQFEPGKDSDGVSVTIPLALLNRAPRYQFDWLVPGLLRDKCIALLKGLPKALRKQLVPVPDVVDSALQSLTPDDVDLCAALSKVLKVQCNVQIQPADWQLEKLEDFYRMNIRLVDERGKLLAQGRDMAALVDQFRRDTPNAVKAISNALERENIGSWDFGDLPVQWRSKAAGMEVVSYPALVTNSDKIDIRLFDYVGDAVLAHRQGFVSLALKRSAQTVKYLRKQLLGSNQAALALAACGLDRSRLVQEIIAAALLQRLPDDGIPRTEDAFSAALEAARAQWVPDANDLESVLMTTLATLADAFAQLNRYRADEYPDSRADIKRQLAALLGPDCVQNSPATWLAQYPRYAKSIRHRAERLSGQYAKDQQIMTLIAPYLGHLAAASERYPGLLTLSSDARQFRWMIEEYRVSLFSQQLGTKVPISAKRLDQQWQKITAWLAANPR